MDGEIGENQVFGIRNVHVDKIIAFQMEISINRWIFESGVQRNLNWIYAFQSH